MLHESYGGRKAIHHYLATGRLIDIRVPPLQRLGAGERRPEPKPAPNPNAARKRKKYYDAPIVDMGSFRGRGGGRRVSAAPPFRQGGQMRQFCFG